MLALLIVLQVLAGTPVPPVLSVRVDVPIKEFPPRWPVLYELMVRNDGKDSVTLDPEIWSDFVAEHRSKESKEWRRCSPSPPENVHAYSEYRAQLRPVVLSPGQASSFGFHYMDEQCQESLLPGPPATVVVRLYGKMLGVTLWSNEVALQVNLPTEFDKSIIDRTKFPADVPESLLALSSYLSFRGKTRANLVVFSGDRVFRQTRFPDGSPDRGAIARLEREAHERTAFVAKFPDNPFNDDLRTDVAINLLALGRRPEAIELLTRVEKRAAHRETREKAGTILSYLKEHPKAGASK